MPDNSVEIDSKMTTEGVEKGVKKINQEINKIEKEAEKTTKKTAGNFKKLDTVMQEASSTASGFANKISNAASSGGLYVAVARWCNQCNKEARRGNAGMHRRIQGAGKGRKSP